jgi:hypothetical protein
VSFNNATRQSIIQLPPIPYAANTTQSIQLPQVGFLSEILIPCQFVIQSNGTLAATNLTAPQITPYQVVKRLTLRTNEGAEIYATSGEGNYFVTRYLRSSFDPRNPLTTVANTNVVNSVFQLPPSYAISTTYNINFTLYIPVALQQSLLAGLILLQSPTTRLTLEIQWGDILVDPFNISAGAFTLTSGTTLPSMMIYNLPASQDDYPDVSWVHVIQEEIQPVANTGDFLYRPPLGNMYLRVIQEFINNNARMTPANFSRLSLNYAQTQTAYNINPAQQAWMQRFRLGGLDLPDGVWAWDFLYGTGILEMGNMRDVIDTARLTDMNIISTIAGSVTLTNAFVRNIKEMLAPISR